jgi:hypothetical protein
MPPMHTSSFSEPSCSIALVAVSHLPLLGEFDGAARQREVPRRVYQRPSSEQARAEGQQAATGGIAGRL